VRDKLWDAGSARLTRSFRLGASVAGGYADDYAYLISGLLDLYQVDAPGVLRQQTAQCSLPRCLRMPSAAS